MTARESTQRKPRELVNFMMDSRRWNDFRYRDGDIVIGTWAKSGTTWTQQIVSQLVFNGAEDKAAADIAPWLDMRIMPLEATLEQLEGQKHRRFVKTHLPADALPFSPLAKYLYIGRDGRDVFWSWHNHLMRMLPPLYDAFNDPPGLPGQPVVRPDADIGKAFSGWLAGEGYSIDTFLQHVQSWWDVRNEPNVLLVHFANLKQDMASQIRRIAEFLEIEIDTATWPAILEHCSFDYMKKNADSLSDVGKNFFEGGLSNFIYKGTNGRWREVLSAAQIERYEVLVEAALTPPCAHWLFTGALDG